MATGTVFEFVAEELERSTDFDKLEARGTVRLALRQSGLDARTVGGDQMAVVLTRVLPGELMTRGGDGPESVCEGTLQALKSSELGGASDDRSPEAIFKRIGGG